MTDHVMDRQSVTSSDLSSVGYDPDIRILEIEFHGGRVYHYFEVPAAEYSALMDSPSKGRYFHQQIKDIYRCVRVS